MDGLLFRRQMMGRSSTPPTPVPYDAGVEYLESNGTQWLNLNYIPIIGDSFDVEVFPVEASSAPSVQTVLSAGDSNNQLVIPVSGVLVYFRYFSSSGSSGMSFPKGRWHSISVDSSGNFELDGTIVTTVHSQGDIDGTNKNLRLLYRANNTNPFYGRIRYFRLVSGNTTIFDLIPVRVGQVGYMYDRVSGQLFGNAGTGDFILGPDV